MPSFLQHYRNVRKYISWVDVVFSVALASVFIGGYLLSTYADLDLGPLNKKLTLLYSAVFVLYFFIALFVLKAVQNMAFTTKKASTKNRLLNKLPDKQFWMLFTVLIFLCYIPIIVSSFAILTPDSWSSARQAMGLDELTNAHPIIFTFFLGIFIKVGELFGNLEIGLLLFSTVQSLIMSCIFAFSLVWIRNVGANRYFILASFIFYALFPLNSFMGIVIWKDVLFAGFGLILLILSIDLFKKERLLDKKSIALFVLAAFLFSVWRHNGIYVYFLFLVLLAVINYKHIFNRRHAILLLSPLGLYILYSMVVSIVIPPATSSSSAMLIVPIQQIARTVTYHDQTLTVEEKTAIGEIFDYENLGALYNPNLSDPVKINMEKFEQNKTRYFKLWLSLGVKYTKTYVASFVYNNYRYFYPYFVSLSTLNLVDSNSVQRWAPETYKDTVFEEGYKRAAAEYRNTSYAIVPMLYSIGFYVLTAIVCAYVAIKKRLTELAAVFILLASLLLTILLGPLNGELRYLYLFVIAAPFIIAAVFYGKSNKLTAKIRIDKAIDC